MTVEDVEPRSGRVAGGTLVTPILTPHMPLRAAFCKFGGIVIQATVVKSGSSLLCQSPRAEETGFVAFDIGIDAADFTTSGLLYRYESQPRVQADPARVAPASMLRMVMRAGAYSGADFCQFGWTFSTASYVRSKEIVCTTPEVMVIESAIASLVGATVQLSQSSQVQLHPRIIVEQASPPSGLAGSTVMLKASFLPPSVQLLCVFYLTDTAVWASGKSVMPSSISCKVPLHY